MNLMKERHPQLYKLSTLMDSRFKFLGINFGLDFLLGLIPYIGNLATTGISLTTLFYAAFHGAPLIVLIRMLLNVSIDLLLTAIPLLGNFADIFWRSNAKNYQLLENYTRNPQSTIRRSAVTSTAIVGSYLAILILIFYLIYKLTTYLISLF